MVLKWCEVQHPLLHCDSPTFPAETAVTPLTAQNIHAAVIPLLAATTVPQTITTATNHNSHNKYTTTTRVWLRIGGKPTATVLIAWFFMVRRPLLHSDTTLDNARSVLLTMLISVPTWSMDDMHRCVQDCVETAWAPLQFKGRPSQSAYIWGKAYPEIPTGPRTGSGKFIQDCVEYSEIA
jgi:hypothetical protein